MLLQPTTKVYVARAGEPIHYAEREKRSVQDWMRMPVSGISWDDALAYTAWLSRTDRVPGARPCHDHEWERAARGADARAFPNGNRLDRDDANIDETYGRKPYAFGPDEVGAHPASDSPFGVSDLAGNAWEMVSAVSGNGEIGIRGGGWYHDQLSARSNDREAGNVALRAADLGLRVCAPAPRAR